jgi:aspartate-semialdehyde dehydrogenase
MQHYRVGILGATGLVGQRLVERLHGHPWFEVKAVAASERSKGRRFAEACDWSLPQDPPPAVAGMTVRPCLPEDLQDCDLVLSALDADTARDVEPRFAAAGFAVVSNSSAFRNQRDVPLLIPEVNAHHAELLAEPPASRSGGFIVTNPNCAVAGLAMVLAPLHRAFCVRRLVVATLQAASGAGAEGPRAIQLIDNVIPYIAGEEEKFEPELCKILGEPREGVVAPASIGVSAQCHRVPTLDGHLAAVSVELEESPAVEDVVEALEGFRGRCAELALPSAPQRPIAVRREEDRPQPRLDREAGGGMTVVVGRLRVCPVLGLKLVLLSHNTVRGAAGGTLLNAELLAARRFLPRRTGS